MATEATNNQEEKPKEPKKDLKDFKHGKKDFEMGQLLGGGAFAKVVEGTVINENSPQYGTKYAVKVMDKKHIVKNNKIKYVTIEKKVFLATADHPFICHLHFTFQDSYSLFMVLDLCEDAELSYQIWKYQGLTEQITVFYLSEIVSCLQYMHSKGIYHRDIKPENVLLHNTGHIRLTDFGTAKILDKNDKNDESDKKENDESNKNKKRKGSFVGTAQYVPPELLDKESSISYAGMDFWALGILIYQCLCNKTPFNAPNEYLTFKKIEDHDFKMPDDLSNNSKNVINDFLTKDYTERLGMNGFDEIKQHKFFESIKSWEWDDLLNLSPPKYPSTPKTSPVHDEDQKKKLRESVYGGDAAISSGGNVKPLDNADDLNDLNDLNDINEKSVSRQSSTQELNDSLYKNWKQFLHAQETIVMGSTVEQKSGLFGMSTTKSVMLFTSQRRILLIDTQKMQIRKNGDIPRSSIVSCNVIDKLTFELLRVKKNLKFKCMEPKAQKWKKAFDKYC